MTLVSINEGFFSIEIQENFPANGKKIKFVDTLNPSGMIGGPKECLFNGCTNMMMNKFGICSYHSKPSDLILYIKDNDGNIIEKPSYYNLVPAIIYYESINGEDRTFDLIKKVKSGFLGNVPPYFIQQNHVKGYYDTDGNFHKYHCDFDMKAVFEKIYQSVDGVFSKASNEYTQPFAFSKENPHEYSFRLYLLAYLFLIVIEEMNRGDLWTSLNFHGITDFSRLKGGNMPIIDYWMSHFPKD